MKRESALTAPVLVPGVVSLAASSRRTLKHGPSFALFDEFGDILEFEHSPAGLFHHDTRFLSRLRFTLEGHRPMVLSSTVQPDNVMLDVDLTNPDLFDAEGRLALAKDTFHVARAKFLWEAACYELFTVASYGDTSRRLHLALDFAADFADLFEIRGYRRARRGAVRARTAGAEVCFDYESLDGVPRTTRLSFAPRPARLTAEAAEGRAEFELELASRERRPIALTVQCLEGDVAPPGERRFFVMRRVARRALTAAREDAPALESSSAVLNSVLERSSADLAMLMTDTPQGAYPYAGVPWFSTPFGRDGLLTALEMLWIEPALARGVLRFLAAHQATREDPAADMEPGKIVHELRECELARLGEVPFGRYYGSIDSTPLFVALAGLYWERTRDRDTVQAIWPNILAALGWIERSGDADGDGFIEYDRRRSSGLRNQGWKDSDDALFHADGSLASGPIALCEVQGYVYLAYRVAARLAADMDDLRLSAGLTLKAENLRRRFEQAFWDDELGTYALALDGAKRPCAVRTSNAGQLLFTGIAAPERGARLAQGLLDADFFTGWGIRTVNRRERRYNPASYHNGSVWPHDNAIIALGLARYGHCAEALELSTALFDAAAHMHLRRLPELFCGFERKRGKAPTLYPVACAPQAWAAVAPYALLQACLGIEVDCGAAKLRLRKPRLPHFVDWMTVKRLSIGRATVDLMLKRQDSSVAVSLLARNGAADVEVML
ncbi:MAG TPA: amylo-alpha-1,6-glucosidase [Burkholderiales bacterium]|nr:amylo-alpha-1,6-glucosidase [Burkholderiales bacterium]